MNTDEDIKAKLAVGGEKKSHKVKLILPLSDAVTGGKTWSGILHNWGSSSPFVIWMKNQFNVRFSYTRMFRAQLVSKRSLPIQRSAELSWRHLQPCSMNK